LIAHARFDTDADVSMDFSTTRLPRPILVGGATAATGPLVVPSYSSKALARISVSTTLENTAEFQVP
jgi:hypothetical protein